MGQDEKQLTTQTSNNIVDHETETCDSEEARQEDGTCVDKKTASPAKGDESLSDPALPYLQWKARRIKEETIWVVATLMAFLLMVVGIVFAIQIFFESFYILEAVLSCLEVLLGFLLYACLKRCNKEEYKKVVAVVTGVVMVALIVVPALIDLVAPIVSNWISLIPASGIDVDPFLFAFILVTLLFAGFASYGLLICWKVEDAKDARERTIGMATIASVVGILLTVALAFMSTLDSSDYDVESYSSNEVLVDTYQDESYGG